MNRIVIRVPWYAEVFSELRDLNLTMACSVPAESRGFKDLIIVADDETLVMLKLKYANFQQTISEKFNE